MEKSSPNILRRLWKYCTSLFDEGLSVQDYTEQLQYLIFLKMADEHTRPPFNRPSIVPEEYNWSSLLSKEGEELLAHYNRVLEALQKEEGLPEEIFKNARNKIEDPEKLKYWIDLIDKGNWFRMNIDTSRD